MNSKKLSSIFNQIMTEIYQVSIPSANWTDLVEKYRDPETGISNIPFWNYTVSSELLELIVEKYIKKYHINPTDAETLRIQVLLGPSPDSLRKAKSSDNQSNP